MTVLISEKVDFIRRKFTMDKKEHHIMIKESIHQENITILSVYTPKSRASKYKKQNLIELKEEIVTSTITFGDSTLLSG